MRFMNHHQWNSTVGFIESFARHHLDALDDGANGVAEGAAGARVVVHLSDMFVCV
jgi:hypothetical protein